MADVKISQLTGSTTPLVGTEVLPLVQSNTTKKVSVSDLTTGRAVSSASVEVTGSTPPNNGVYLPSANTVAISTNSNEKVRVDVNGNVGVGTLTPTNIANAASISVNSNAVNTTGLVIFQNSSSQSFRIGGLSGWSTFQDLGSANGISIDEQSALPIRFNTDGTPRLYVQPTTGNIQVQTGNVVMATAAKGINFTANTPAAGMTSQLLNWYEEGTWTPNQGAAVSVVGAYSSSGTYTRVGRTVTITAMQSGATSISTSPSGIIFSNLPFTVGGGVTRYSGTTALQFSNVAGAIAVGGTTNVYSCGTLSGGDTIVTTLTYEV